MERSDLGVLAGCARGIGPLLDNDAWVDGWVNECGLVRGGVGGCLAGGGSLVGLSVRIDTMAFADTVIRLSWSHEPKS
jgi:hypothetical protein